MEVIQAFYFGEARLLELAKEHSASFRNAEPFPHVVIDEFLPAEIANAIADEFPGADAEGWKAWGPGPSSRGAQPGATKLGLSDESHFGALTRHVMHELNSHGFLRFLEMLTGELGLIPDPSFNQCGLHSTGPGGRLMLHVDQDRYPLKGKAFQRFNLIYFLNRNWQEEWGGHLELWDKSAKRCEKRVAPSFNRCVIFDTGRYSYHGHPEPLRCPPDRRRNSLAVYYYTHERAPNADYHGYQEIIWSGSGVQEKLALATRDVLKKTVPPILLDLARAVRSRARR